MGDKSIKKDQKKKPKKVTAKTAPAVIVSVVKKPEEQK